MIGIRTEHVELAELVHKFAMERDLRGSTRAALDRSPALPPYWQEMADLGWLGLHVAEEHGGSGFGLEELLIVVEQLGRAAAGGPLLTTCTASALLATVGPVELQAELLPGLVDGSIVASYIEHGTFRAGALDIASEPALCGALADLFVVSAGDDVCLVGRDSPGLSVAPGGVLDLSRPAAVVSASGVEVAEARVLRGAGRWLGALLGLMAAADAVGGAVACVEAACAYAKERTAFARPIGQFQAVKHHCATMLSLTELATAAVWASVSAAAAFGLDEFEDAVDTAVAVALPAFLSCAALNIQVHGGIGFTWEHDAHLQYRRAGTLRALADPTGAAASRIAVRLAERESPAAYPAPSPDTSLPDDLEAAIGFILALEPTGQLAATVSAGLLFPELPPPWGIGAEPELQLRVDRALRGLNRTARLDPMNGWMVPIVVPTLIRYGSPDQQDRWIVRTLTDRLRWCQLFSEPGAGSDLASLATRGQRGEGGWRVSGQKVWTSSALQAGLGLALVRTDSKVPKHQGITCMVIGLSSPGVVIRPLRDMTGQSDFNEVFLDDVFVPDSDVIGQAGEGWAVARTALSNERASLADRREPDPDPELLRRTEATLGPAGLSELGQLVASERAISALNERAVARALAGEPSPAESAVAKLAGAEHEQHLTDFVLRTYGSAAMVLVHDLDSAPMRWLRSRRATIAGGTSEILLNVIGERLLGLPRDPP
jgi:alkylation response protein AidB-like acyl-CoA dehydrogenase